MMTIGQCIAQADQLRANSVSEQEKIRWLFDLDMQLRHEFFPRYEREDQDGEELDRAPREDADVETLRDYKLSVSGPYQELYVFYLASRVDFAMEEMETYSFDNAMFQQAMDDFRKDYNRTHMPKSAKFDTRM